MSGMVIDDSAMFVAKMIFLIFDPGLGLTNACRRETRLDLGHQLSKPTLKYHLSQLLLRYLGVQWQDPPFMAKLPGLLL